LIEAAGIEFINENGGGLGVQLGLVIEHPQRYERNSGPAVKEVQLGQPREPMSRQRVHFWFGHAAAADVCRSDARLSFEISLCETFKVLPDQPSAGPKQLTPPIGSMTFWSRHQIGWRS
jgi:hypothetical protein